VAAVIRIGAGVYRVEGDGRRETVYVAGPAHDRWTFWNGMVFRLDVSRASPAAGRSRSDRGVARQALAAPMPATVIRILVTAGDVVKKGDTILILEAMKMELPVRAPADARVSSVSCREGELVQPDAVLVELE
jgi:biotin carboxyl carrier protein